MKKLTREEFDSALHKGLGRAFLHVQRYGDQNLEDILKNAVLHNLVYDVQCEGGRADWLFSILKNTNNLNSYEEFLINNLSNIEGDLDCNQAFDLLSHFAKNGSPKARIALYEEFNKQNRNESWIGGKQIIELDGIEGFFHVAEYLGKRLRKDSTFWEDEFLLDLIKEHCGEEKVTQAINKKLKTSEDLKFYLDRIVRWEGGKAESKEQIKARMRKRFPLKQIQQDIESAKGDFPGHYLVFGRYALDKDISELFRQLKNENRKPQLIRLLRIFRMRELPEINEKIISHALSEDSELSEAAIWALSNSRDSKLNALALDILKGPEWSRAALGFRLLIKNYCQKDNQAIEKVLGAIPGDTDREQIHSIVYSLVKVCAENNSIETKKILKWIYENSPCMNCRSHAVEQLVQNKKISKRLLQECLVDGDEEIREIAGKYGDTIPNKNE